MIVALEVGMRTSRSSSLLLLLCLWIPACTLGEAADIDVDVQAVAPGELVFFDDFGSGLELWRERGEGDWITESPESRTGYPSQGSAGLAAHADNCDTLCVIELSSPLDLSEASRASVELLRYVDARLDQGEFLEMQGNGGDGWKRLARWEGGRDDDSRWHRELIDLDAYAGRPSVRIRFRTTVSAANEHVLVDDVAIRAIEDSAPQPTPAPPSTAPAGSASLLFVGDFESGDLSAWSSKLYDGGHAEVVAGPARGGRHAVHFWTEAKEIVGPYRAELRSVPRFNWQWDDGKSHWVGFSFYLDAWDPVVPANTFFQIHAPNEPAGGSCDYAGNTVTVKPKDGNLIVTVIENGGVSAGKGAGSNTTQVYSEPMRSNAWHDWVVNFTLSSKGQGFYRVWKNGQLVYEKHGLTNVNHRDSCGVEIPADKRAHNGPHIGIYAPQPSTYPATYRSMYYDEVRVAEGEGGYALVAP